MVEDGPRLRLDTSFETGSVGSWAVTGDTVEFTVRPDADGARRDWYSFRLEGTGEDSVTFRIVNRSGPAYARPLVSRDGGTSWERIVDVESGSDGITFRHLPAGEREWFAFQPAYPVSRWLARLEAIRSDPRVVRAQVLARSLASQPVHLLEITDPGVPSTEKSIVWALGRQHPSETGGSWMIEGLLDWLLGDSPQAAALLEGASVFVIPLMNPDGVIRGDDRMNMAGLNLNRQWAAPSAARSPTVLAATEAILESASSGRDIVLLADFHSTRSGHANFVYYSDAATTSPAAFDDIRAFIARAEELNPDWSLGHSEATPAPGNRARGWAYTALATHGITLESAPHDLTYGPRAGEYMDVERLRELGSAIGQAIAEHFYGLPAAAPSPSGSQPPG